MRDNKFHATPYRYDNFPIFNFPKNKKKERVDSRREGKKQKEEIFTGLGERSVMKIYSSV
jgi:hypothetical protein